MFRKLRNEQGFLLMEGVLAIFIITVALVACMGVVLTSHKAAKVSAGHTAAVYLAQRQAEILKGTKSPNDWNRLYPSLPQNSYLEDRIPLNGITYIVTTKADVCRESPTLVEVTIRVSWQENGSDELYQLITAYPTVSVKRVATT